MATPRTGQREFIGVVGYPGDKDEGEHMYEHFLCADWDLATANENMLEYAIDTCRGKPAINLSVKLDLHLNRSVRRSSPAASIRRTSHGSQSTSVPASFE